MFVSGSVWEAELFIQRQSAIKQVHWEDQKTFLYSQPQISKDFQAIFVVTGYDASYAKRALSEALEQFSMVNHVVGHGFCTGLVKHCEAGDPVMISELMLASFPEILSQPVPMNQMMKPSPLWTRALALKKNFQNEIEKAAVYASSNMEVMDPICGVWYKVLAQHKVPFSFLKGLADGGNEVGTPFYGFLDQRGQFESMKVIKNTITQPFAAFEFHHLRKHRAKELLEKSHEMITALCQEVLKSPSIDEFEATKPSFKLDMPLR